jgi:DNA-binding MarR family transcriptional regulator
MSQLERHPKGLKMNELSRRMMVTGGNVTGIVEQLVEEGLVQRVVEPADRRAFRVCLTRAGDKAFAEMARAHEEWVVQLLAGLGRRDNDALMQLLARLKQVTLEKSA